MTSCKYCRPSPPECWADDEGAYVCTRTVGHSGPHVACDDVGSHEISVWERARIQGTYAYAHQETP